MIETQRKQPDSKKLIKRLKLHRCITCGKCNAMKTNFIEVPDSDPEKVGEIKSVATKWWTCEACEGGAK